MNFTASQRERILEEKNRFLEGELDEAYALISRLEAENVDRLKELCRVRREAEARRVEETTLLADEVRRLVAEVERLRMAEAQRELAANQQQPSYHGTAGAVPSGPSARKAAQGVKPDRSSLRERSSIAIIQQKAVKPTKASKSKSNGPPSSQERNLNKEGRSRGLGGKIYKLSGPKISGANATVEELFEGGFAYKLEVGGKNGGPTTWYLYNDSSDYQLEATYGFTPGSKLQGLDGTILTKAKNGDLEAKATVYPGETKGFVTGVVDGYEASYDLNPLSDQYVQKLFKQAEAVTTETVAKVKAAVATSGLSPNQCPSIEVVKVCRSKGITFADMEFPPAHTSLCRPGIDTQKDFKLICWKQPEQFLPPDEAAKSCLFVNGISPNDIDQGELGDCWFLCSVSCVAEFPALIEAIFPPHLRAKDSYGVRLCKHGWWNDVIVDTFLPVKGSAPCFAKTVENGWELWASLLEKAYAKLHGSYAAISGGNPQDALMDLTGLPGMDITERMEKGRKNRSDADSLFNEMLRWDQANYLISVGTPGVDESSYNTSGGSNDASMKKKYDKAGLVNGHAYSVLKVRHFPKHQLRLVQIRNPWGESTEWTGAWGDSDPRWKTMPDVAQGCQFEQASDGTFWMDFSQFLEYFSDGQICIKGPWDFDARVKGSFSKGGVPSVALKISLLGNAPVEVMLGLSQPDPRAFSSKQPDSKKQAMLLTVAQPKGGGQLDNNLCCSDDPMRPTTDRTYKFDRDQHMTLTLQPRQGPYYVIPRLYDDDLTKKDYVLSLYGPKSAFQQKSLRVEFVTLDPKSTVLSNYVEFSEKAALLKPTQAQCQTLCAGNLQQFSGCGELPAVDGSASANYPMPMSSASTSRPFNSNSVIYQQQILNPPFVAPDPFAGMEDKGDDEACDDEGADEEGERDGDGNGEEEEGEEEEGEGEDEEEEAEEAEEEEEDEEESEDDWVPKGKGVKR